MKDCGDCLANRMEETLRRLESLRLAEYLAYTGNTRRMLGRHFLSGLARGLGAAVGFTVLGAVLILFLRHLAGQNLPLIGDFLAQLLTVVQRRLE